MPVVDNPKPLPHKPDPNYDELNAFMIAQMLEEDESRLLAEKLQNEM